MAKKKSNPFKGRTGEGTRRQAAAASQFGVLTLPSGISVFKEKPSENSVRIDILPYYVTEEKHPQADLVTDERLWWCRPYKAHRDIGSENATVVCLSSFGKRCPICVARADLLRTGGDKEGAANLKAKDRVLYYVVPLGQNEYEEKPYIWDISYHNFQVLLGKELKRDENFEGFPNLEDGLTLVIRFDEKSIGTGKPFAQAGRIDFEKRDEDYNEKIIKGLPDLSTLLVTLSYKELDAKFLEIEDEENDDTPADNMPKQPEEFERPESQSESETNDDNECVACEGSGENSKGNECPTCEGSGEKPKDKKVDQEDDEKAKEKARRQKIRDEKKKEKSGGDDDEKCPHGHKYGVDTDNYGKDCDDCKLWEDCMNEEVDNEG